MRAALRTVTSRYGVRSESVRRSVCIDMKLTVQTFLTLDGVMQAPGGPEEDPTGGFTQGGWAMRYGDEAVHAALDQIMAGEFDLLLGRRTYEIFAAYWPYAGDNPIAKAFNKATKYVATHSLEKFEWANSQPIRGDAVEQIRRLKASAGPEMHIWGSGQLLQTGGANLGKVVP